MKIMLFKEAAQLNDDMAKRWYPHFVCACEEFHIGTLLTQAQFIAQVGHESDGFQRLSESFNYSVNTLIQKYVPKDLTLEQSHHFGRKPDEKTVSLPRQRALANVLYENMNGNQQPDDGWTYRGRGLIQLTGRDNYLHCGRALHIDLLTFPNLLETDDIAMRSAAWFFLNKGCLTVSDNIVKVTKIINGGENGLSDREARFEHAKKTCGLLA